MALMKQLVRITVFIHGLLNIAQGFYCVFRPAAWAQTAGEGFIGSPSKAIQSVGLGCIGVGAYGALGAVTGRRSFYITTMLIRVAFASIGLSQWSWEDSGGVIVYEGCVAMIAALGWVL